MGNFHTPLAFKSSPEQEFKRVRLLSVFLLLQIPPLLTPALDSTHLSVRHLPVQNEQDANSLYIFHLKRASLST